MKIFLSWSGLYSKQIALALKKWLNEKVDKSIEAFVSSEDIAMGAMWNKVLLKELDEAQFGIICLTKDNINAPWISFEAGMLSGKKEKANAAPFLVDVTLDEISKSPYRELMAAHFSKKEEVRNLVKSIYGKLGGNFQMSDENLDAIFNTNLWPPLEHAINDIRQQHAEAVAQSARARLLDPMAEVDYYCPVSEDFAQHLRHIYRTHILGPMDNSDLWYMLINTVDFPKCKPKVVEALKEEYQRRASKEDFYDISIWSLLGAAELMIKFRADEEQAKEIEAKLYHVLSGGENGAGKNLLEPTHLNPRGLIMVNIFREIVRDDEGKAFKEGRYIQSRPIPRTLRSIKVFIRLRYERGHNDTYQLGIITRLYQNINSIESVAFTREPDNEPGHIIIEAHFPCGHFSDLSDLSTNLELALFRDLIKETYLAYDVEVIEADDAEVLSTAKATTAP